MPLTLSDGPEWAFEAMREEGWRSDLTRQVYLMPSITRLQLRKMRVTRYSMAQDKHWVPPELVPLIQNLTCEHSPYMSQLTRCINMVAWTLGTMLDDSRTFISYDPRPS